MMLNNRELIIPHMWGIKIIMLYQFPTCGELKLYTVEKLNHAISIPHMLRIEIQNFVCNMGMSVLHQGEKGIG